MVWLNAILFPLSIVRHEWCSKTHHHYYYCTFVTFVTHIFGNIKYLDLRVIQSLLASITNIDRQAD